MIKKKQLFYSFYIFICRFTLLVCGEKNILANLTNSQEPEPLEKKNQEPEPLGKKIRSRSSLKKVRSRSRKKICRLPSPAYYE